MATFAYLKPKTAEREKIHIKPIITGAVLGTLLSLLLLILAAGVILQLKADLTMAPAVAKIIMFFGAFFSGMFSGIGRKNSGWLFGVGAGLLYSVFLLITSFLLVPGQSFTFHTLLSIVLCLVFALIGGVLGINLKIRKKRRIKS